MHECRRAAVHVLTNYPINGDAYRAASALNHMLDDLSETLTGDRKAHWPYRPEWGNPNHVSTEIED